MSDTLTNVAGGLIASQTVGAALDYTLDYSAGLDSGLALTSSAWSAAPGDLTLSHTSFDNTTVTVKCSGGSVGWYVVSNIAVDTGGYTHTGKFTLEITDPTDLQAGLNLPFLSVAGAIAMLRRDRLMQMLLTFAPGADVSDSYLLQKLNAATKAIEHKLRVFLTPREVIPNTALQSEIDSLTTAGNVVVQEPAYDYNPDFFQGNTWGFQPLRQRPIIAVHSMQFVYPTPNTNFFQIPNEWIRLDKKYGTLNLLPVSVYSGLPLNAFILQALGGGRMVPNFVEIRYRAGLENVARDWPDILDIILKQTALSVVEDFYVPSSKNESISADGLSQSSSIGLRMQDYEELVGRKSESVRSALFGIMLAVI